MEVRRAVGDQVKICAVLKAQCYGLGGALVGHVLEELGEKGPDAYAVAVVSEALELREFIPPEKEILVLGYVSEDGYDTVIEHDITLAMYREEALAALDRHAEAMGTKARGICMPTVHCGASPTICDLPEFYRDMVRPGLLLTGWYASDEVSRERIKLQPCVKLKARLGNVMPVKAGEGVGYGFTYHLPEDTLVGVLPLGFSDGFTRAFSNNFFVTIRGHRCAVIGNICMDHCMIDLCNVPDPQIGEEIVVYGDGVEGVDGAMSAQEVANKRGTVVDEVLTNLAARLPRILV